MQLGKRRNAPTNDDGGYSSFQNNDYDDYGGHMDDFALKQIKAKKEKSFHLGEFRVSRRQRCLTGSLLCLNLLGFQLLLLALCSLIVLHFALQLNSPLSNELLSLPWFRKQKTKTLYAKVLDASHWSHTKSKSTIIVETTEKINIESGILGTTEKKQDDAATIFNSLFTKNIDYPVTDTNLLFMESSENDTEFYQIPFPSGELKRRELKDQLRSATSYPGGETFLHPVDYGFDAIGRVRVSMSGGIYDEDLWPEEDTRAKPTNMWWNLWTQEPGFGASHAITQHPYTLSVRIKTKGLPNIVGDTSGLEIMGPMPETVPKMGYMQSADYVSGLFLGVQMYDEYYYVKKHFINDWDDAFMISKVWTLTSEASAGLDEYQIDKSIEARIVRGHPWITMNFPVGVRIVIETLPQTTGVANHIKEASSIKYPPGFVIPSACANIGSRDRPWLDDAISITLEDGTEWAVIFSRPTKFWCDYGKKYDRIYSYELEHPVTVRIGLLDQCSHKGNGRNGNGGSENLLPVLDSYTDLCASEDALSMNKLKWNLISSLKNNFYLANPDFDGPIPWNLLNEQLIQDETKRTSLITFAPHFRKLPIKDELYNMNEMYGGILPLYEKTWTYYDILDEMNQGEKADALILTSNFVQTQEEFDQIYFDSFLTERILSYIWEGGNIILLGPLGGFVDQFLSKILKLPIFAAPEHLLDVESLLTEKTGTYDWGIGALPPYNGQTNVPPEFLPENMPDVMSIPKLGIMGSRDKVGQMSVKYEKYPFVSYCTHADNAGQTKDIQLCDGSHAVTWYFGQGLVHWIGRSWDEESDLDIDSSWVKLLGRSIWSQACLNSIRRGGETSFDCDTLKRIVYFINGRERERETEWRKLQEIGVLDGADNFNLQRLQKFVTGFRSERLWNVGKAVEYTLATDHLAYRDVMLRHALSVPVASRVEVKGNEMSFQKERFTDHDPSSGWINSESHDVFLNYVLETTPLPDASHHSLAPFVWDEEHFRPLWAPERTSFVVNPMHQKLEYPIRNGVDMGDADQVPVHWIRNDVVDESGSCMNTVMGYSCIRSFGPQHECMKLTIKEKLLLEQKREKYNQKDGAIDQDSAQFVTANSNNNFEDCKNFRYWEWDLQQTTRKPFLNDISSLEIPTLSEFRKQYPHRAKKNDFFLKSTMFMQQWRSLASTSYQYAYWKSILSYNPLRPGSVLHRIIDLMGYVVLTSDEYKYRTVPIDLTLQAKPIIKWKKLWTQITRMFQSDGDYIDDSDNSSPSYFKVLKDAMTDEMLEKSQNMFGLFKGEPFSSFPLEEKLQETVAINFRERLNITASHLSLEATGDLYDVASYCSPTETKFVEWGDSSDEPHFLIEFYALRGLDWLAVLADLSGEKGIYLAPRSAFRSDVEYSVQGEVNRLLLPLPKTTFDAPLAGSTLPIMDSLHSLQKWAPFVEKIKWGLNADLVSDKKLDPEAVFIKNIDDYSDWLRVGFKYAQMALLAHVSNDIIPKQQAETWLEMILTTFLKNQYDNPLMYDISLGGLVPCGCDREANQDMCTPAPRLGYAEIVEGHSSLSFSALDITPWLSQACPAFNSVLQQGGLGFYQDHHKIYGHIVYIAAVLEYISPNSLEKEVRIETNYGIFRASLSEFVELFILDYAAPVHAEPYNNIFFQDTLQKLFPPARQKDWYTFNSFSNGLNLSDELGPYGRGYMEAAFSYWAVALYGLVRGDPALENWGRILASTELFHANTYNTVKEWTVTYPEAIRYLGGIGTRADKGGLFLGTKGVQPFQVMSEMVQPFTVFSSEAIEAGWAMWAVQIWELSCRADLKECIDSFADLPLELMKFLGAYDWERVYEKHEAIGMTKRDQQLRSGLYKFGSFLDVGKYLNWVDVPVFEKETLSEAKVLEKLAMQSMSTWATSLVANGYCFKVGSYDCGIYTLSDSLMFVAYAAYFGGAAKELERQDGNGPFRIY